MMGRSRQGPAQRGDEGMERKWWRSCWGVMEAHGQRWYSEKMRKFLQLSGVRDYENLQLWIVENKSQ